MPTARRTRVLAASPQEIWAVVGDPHHLPRWWPHVQRVEAVDGGAFTEVLVGESGRAVRADFRITERKAPRACGWEQQIEDTPFARVFISSQTSITVDGEDGGTRVTITLEQKLRGVSKLGGLLARRGSGQLLDRALDGLEALHA